MNIYIKRLIFLLKQVIAYFHDFTYTWKKNDVVMSLPISHPLPYYLSIYKFYSQNIIRIAKLLNQYDNTSKMIDIGANVGDTAAFVRKDNSMPILCIEGDSTYYKYLCKNTSMIKDLVRLRSFVGNRSGIKKLYYNSKNGTGGIVDTPTKKVVNFKKLDDILKIKKYFSNSNLLKVDTDGFDIDIMLSGLKYLKAISPVIFFEMDPYLTEKTSISRFFAKMMVLGYRYVIFYDNFGIPVYYISNFNSIDVDVAVSYFSGHKGNFYSDVCLIHGKDKKFFTMLKIHEMSYFSKVDK